MLSATRQINVLREDAKPQREQVVLCGLVLSREVDKLRVTHYTELRGKKSIREGNDV